EHASLVSCISGPVRDKPVEATFEVRQSLQELWLKRVDRIEWYKPNHGARLHCLMAAPCRACIRSAHGNFTLIRNVKNVIKESVLLIPKTHSIVATIVHRVCDLCEVLPEFARHILVSRIFVS